jgi:hypothetical protein
MVGESAVALKAAWIMAVSFAVTLAAILLWPNIPLWARSTKCDSSDAIATVKSLAVERLESFGAVDYLIRKGVSFVETSRLRKASINRTIGDYAMTLGAIRDRGAIGKGVSCAGIIYISPKSGAGPEFATEYTVEPTTDGKTIVTAKFMPD